MTTETTKEINGKELRTNKTKPPNMKVCRVWPFNGMTSDMRSTRLPWSLAPKREVIRNEHSISAKANTWVSAERNIEKFFKEKTLTLKGKYGNYEHTTSNEDDVGKHVPYYIGGYNNLTKRKHNTWKSITKTLREYYKLTDDIDMACESMNDKTKSYYRSNVYYPYVDFNSKNINKILSLQPEKIYSHIRLPNGESVPNIISWGAERLKRIQQGLTHYSTFLNDLYKVLWYRKNNPKARAFFKGKVYTRPIYYFDYNLKSAQSPYGAVAGRAFPEDWTIDDVKVLYGMTNADGRATKKVFWNLDYNLFSNVSKNWTEACDYQRKLNYYEINEAITLEDVQQELFDVIDKISTIGIYRVNMKQSDLYANYKQFRSVDYLTDKINSTQERGLKDYWEKLDYLKRDKNDIIRFEALKLIKGKSMAFTLEEDYTKMHKDKDKSVWYDALVQRGIDDFSSIGDLENQDLVVITKEEYIRLKEMRME